MNRILSVKIIGWQLIGVTEGGFAVYEDSEEENYGRRFAVVDLERGNIKILSKQIGEKIEIWQEKDYSQRTLLKINIFDEEKNEAKVFTFWRGINKNDIPLPFFVEEWGEEIIDGEEVLVLKNAR